MPTTAVCALLALTATTRAPTPLRCVMPVTSALRVLLRSSPAPEAHTIRARVCTTHVGAQRAMQATTVLSEARPLSTRLCTSAMLDITASPAPADPNQLTRSLAHGALLVDTARRQRRRRLPVTLVSMVHTSELSHRLIASLASLDITVWVQMRRMPRHSAAPATTAVVAP